MEVPRLQSVRVDEVIMEILSWVPVKHLLRFRCVCKFWKSLISDPSFVKLHLQRSPKNANLVLTLKHTLCIVERDSCVVSCSKRSFLENPSSTVAAEEGRHLLNKKYLVLGSCNGLVCLRGYFGGVEDKFEAYWVRFWNPATRLRSKKSPRLHVDFRVNQIDFRVNQIDSTKFGFGYDKSSDTYKVVALLNKRNAREDSMGTEVQVYCMGDNCWRDIQRFPAFPILFGNEGRFLSGTLNWLASRNSGSAYKWYTVTIDQLVIVSLDLGKETYKQLLLPDGLDEVPHVKPTLWVLMDCLCLSHDYKTTHFVVWQMKEFGVEKSWTRFVNVSYQHLQIEMSSWSRAQFYYSLVPLCISENGDVLMLIVGEDYGTILYNWRHNRVERTGIPKSIIWIYATDYVQSLVLPC